MLHGRTGTDEIEDLIELIVGVLFSSICVAAIAYMTIYMSKWSNHYHAVDKLEVTIDKADDVDPFNFTGWQAYMFAWVMDPYSDVSLTWLGGTDRPVSARTDGLDDNHVTIGTLDASGSTLTTFLAWRNQQIVGGPTAPTRNVKNVVKSANVNTNALFLGQTYTKFHLELTGDYTINEDNIYSDVGHTLVERRKVYKWVLVPREIY